MFKRMFELKKKRVLKDRKVDDKNIALEKLIPVENVLLDYLYALYQEDVKIATISGTEVDCLKMKHRYWTYVKTKNLINSLKSNLGKKKLKQ